MHSANRYPNANLRGKPAPHLRRGYWLVTTKISAKATSFTDDGYCTLLGFADDPSVPLNYVTLDMANDPDEQDLALGLGGVHIDAGALDIDGYDLVEDICETEAGVIVRLTADVARNAGIDQDIEIETKRKIIDGVATGEAVQMFKRRLLSWAKAKAK